MQWTFVSESFPRATPRSAHTSQRLKIHKATAPIATEVRSILALQPSDLAYLTQITNPLEKSKVFDLDIKHRHELNSLSTGNSIRYKSPRVSSCSPRRTRQALPQESLVFKREPLLHTLVKDPVFFKFYERIDEAACKRFTFNPGRSAKLHTKFLNSSPRRNL